MRSRPYYVSFWLDEQEHDHLLQLCADTGLTASALLRHLIAGTELRPKPPQEYAALLRELSAIGRNVNQIARWANTQEAISEEELSRVLDLVGQAWRLVKDTL